MTARSETPDRTVTRDGTEWERAKARALKRDQYRCQHCTATPSKTPGVDLQVHHIRPVENGGTNDLDNLVVLCNSCHWDLHRNHDDKEELPPELLEGDDRAEWPFPEQRRDFGDLDDLQQDIVMMLKENGPMKLKDIIEVTDYSREWVNDNLESLMIGKRVCRISRGVYAYIPEKEYRELLTREADETGRYAVNVWDPGKQVTLEEAMTDE